MFTTYRWIFTALALAFLAEAARKTTQFVMTEKKRGHLIPILDAMRDLGFKEHVRSDLELGSYETLQDLDDYDLIWTWAPAKFLQLPAGLKRHHRINHFPGSITFASKQNVYNTMKRMGEIYGAEHFNFVPQQFQFPEEMEAFEKAYAESQAVPVDPVKSAVDPMYKKRWLAKSKKHRRVRFFDGNMSMVTNQDMLAQCIEPYLVSGHKFDIGIYTVVSSLDPLRVYVYYGAKLRFCQEPYPTVLDNDSPHKSYVVVHYLTPWQVPALKHNYPEPPMSHTDPGVNDYEILKTYMESVGMDSAKFQRQLYGSIVKMLTANRDTFMRMTRRVQEATGNVNDGYGNFFEMWRWDFVVDDAGKPWLMEVNLSPNLGPYFYDDKTTDWGLKYAVVHDLLHLINPMPPRDETDPPLVYMIERDAEYCTQQCSDDASAILDMTCWRCWYSESDAEALYESVQEYERRGRYTMVFPTPSNEYAQFLAGGPTLRDTAFQRYLTAYALQNAKRPQFPNDDTPVEIPKNVAAETYLRGDIVNFGDNALAVKDDQLPLQAPAQVLDEGRVHFDGDYNPLLNTDSAKNIRDYQERLKVVISDMDGSVINISCTALVVMVVLFVAVRGARRCSRGKTAQKSM